MEINVGDYVRTKYGIGKIINFENDLININLGYKETIDYKTELFGITKHSKDIIDLILKGDVVVGIDNHKFEVYAVGKDCVYINGMEEFILIKDIKSVLTKQQFEANAYTIEKER